MAELQGKLEELERERDELDSECNQLHEKHGDALNEIESLKEQLATVSALQSADVTTTVNALQSEPAASARDFPDLEKIRDRVVSKWSVVKGPEKKERIKLALDRFIEAIRKYED